MRAPSRAENKDREKYNKWMKCMKSEKFAAAFYASPSLNHSIFSVLTANDVILITFDAHRHRRRCHSIENNKSNIVTVAVSMHWNDDCRHNSNIEKPMVIVEQRMRREWRQTDNGNCVWKTRRNNKYQRLCVCSRFIEGEKKKQRKFCVREGEKKYNENKTRELTNDRSFDDSYMTADGMNLICK